jgi:hypothetical protein
MTHEDPIDLDDVATAIREGRPLHPAHAFRIHVALNGVAFEEATVADSHPLGRQIVAAVGLDPHTDPSLFAVLPSGDFDEIVLDQPVDLRGVGAHRFIVFTSDRDFKFTLNGAQARWFQPRITGNELCVLGAASSEDIAFLLDGDARHPIERDAVAELGGGGVEHFVIGPRRRSFDIIVNGREFRVQESRQTFEHLVALAFPQSPPEQNITYSITYRRAASQPHAGELGVGGFIEVQDGTIVNVTRTVQS